ncbi:putative ABC transport system permease protein [Sulfuritortus calidifontis]|uniref:Putative ABC transport system permease protein n=1 Tax=Sulfuritortus calidifontis TaxID=1914471 RepID=A0A4R3JXM9_9PROT|nr:ABC transporter permease [Sulfuritortus calidifontis]TCS73084.1 putative ABC transport system permease protein [Sulfuritortus calidifontis]
MSLRRLNLGALLAESLRAMAMNRLRTALAMLGMVIGVAAVVLMLAVGRGAQLAVEQSIASMGSNLFIVLSGASTSGGLRTGAGTIPTLTLNDAEAIAQLPSVKAAAPVFQGSAQMVYGANNWSTVVYGSTPAFFEVRGWSFAAGHGFDHSDVRGATRVVVLGKTVAQNLFGDEDPVGKMVRIRNSPYRVVGLLEAKGQSLDGRDQDDTAMVPVTTAQRKLFGNPFPGTVRFISVQAVSSQMMEEAEREMTQLLRQRHRLGERAENDFTIRNLTASAEAEAASAKAMSFMLGAIASISLLVGGIGIMNIMLVSVTERTREIGIRMAVGARRRDILVQFLLEAVIICVAGGLIGVLLGVGGAWLMSATAGMTVVVTLGSILLAFAFAAGIGIFFGFYPARRGAGLSPVEALRYE